MPVRKNYRDLSNVERDRLVQALYHVKATGIVDQFANEHATHFFHGIHRSSHFLPWHREFLRRFEDQLQTFHPDVTIPYWNSTVDTSPSDPLWSNAFLGQFNAAWGLNRALGSAVLPTPQRLQQTLGLNNYGPFWDDLEVAIHNPPHRWVAGVMGGAASPGDPVFYFHHCWIDRIWALWQVSLGHAGAAFFTASGPDAELNDPLMGWTTTAADVLDHRALGYSYDFEVPAGPVAQGNDMQPGEVLNPGQSITSANSRYTFVYQGDGNLVLYRSDGRPLWASGTAGTPAGVCIMQGDGNLVIYAPGGGAIWDSGTWQHPGSSLILQDDGNVVIYRPDGQPVWATNTWIPSGPTAQGTDMQPGEVLYPNESITSANGRYTFIHQGDGNLVLYRNDGRALWASGTDGELTGVCIMQGDGNLVIYGYGGEPIWDSGTWQHPGSGLVVQDDGNVVIYRPDGQPVWATNTWLPMGPTAQGSDMQPGEVLNPNDAITSANGLYTFVHQGDGNLVLYRNDGTPLWASGTDGRLTGVCIMQGDGNLVIYGYGGGPIWDSGTWQHPGSSLIVQDDGNVVIYRPDGTPVWATNTVQ